MNSPIEPLDEIDTIDRDIDMIDKGKNECLVNSNNNGYLVVEQADPLLNTEKKVIDTWNNDENMILYLIVDTIDDTITWKVGILQIMLELHLVISLGR